MTKEPQRLAKSPSCHPYSPFFTTREGGLFSWGPLSRPRWPEWLWRKPLAVACNRRSSSKWHSRHPIADGICNWLASFVFQHPMVHFMIGPFPFPSWLMKRAVRVGQEALCRPGGATFCFWSINNANEATVSSLCLDDRSRHLLFLSRTLLDLWRLPPLLAVKWQTSAHLAISLIFMSAPWGVNERRRCRCLPLTFKKIKSNRAVSSSGARCGHYRKWGLGQWWKGGKIRGGQLVNSQLQIFLICCKSYSPTPPNPRGCKGGPCQWTKVFIMCWPAKYIIHRATSYDLLTSRASCFTLEVFYLLASAAGLLVFRSFWRVRSVDAVPDSMGPDPLAHVMIIGTETGLLPMTGLPLVRASLWSVTANIWFLFKLHGALGLSLPCRTDHPFLKEETLEREEWDGRGQTGFKIKALEPHT